MKKLLPVYLVVGLLYQLVFYRSINPLSAAFWLHILLWLPLIAVHWFVSFVVTAFILAAVLWLVSTFWIPDLGKFFAYVWKKAVG